MHLLQVRKKAFTRLLRLQGMLAALLFLPAWSLRCWHAWVYWIVFSACMLAITWYFLAHDPGLMESRLKVGPGAERETGQKVIRAVASVVACLVVVVPGIERRFHPSVVPLPVVLAADALVVAGFAIVFRVFRENSHASSLIEVRPGQQVIATGPYSVVRHPMYAGALLIMVATPVALGSWWALVCVVPLCGAVVARLVGEERYLSQMLRGYQEYCREVRHRLIPHVW
jgi:protein-S-isoprenylcysteine O-methyltransferase Ste14